MLTNCVTLPFLVLLFFRLVNNVLSDYLMIVAFSPKMVLPGKKKT